MRQMINYCECRSTKLSCVCGRLGWAPPLLRDAWVRFPRYASLTLASITSLITAQTRPIITRGFLTLTLRFNRRFNKRVLCSYFP